MPSAQQQLNEALRQRVAVFVPQNRRWSWQHTIISSLRTSYDVDVYQCANAPPYPWLLSTWMRFESWLFGAADHVSFFKTNEDAAGLPRDLSTYTFILNLSESELCASDAPILQPRFNGHSDSLYVVGALLSRKTPHLTFHLQGIQDPIAASYPAIEDRIVLQRGLQFAFVRLVSLADRAVRHLVQETRQPILPQAIHRPDCYSARKLGIFFVRLLVDKLVRRPIRMFQIQEYWSTALLAYHDSNLPSPADLRACTAIPDDGERFYADPFLISHLGQTWLFVEELEFHSGKGVISCIQIQHDGRTEGPVRVLERPYHLSYPNVFQYGDVFFMIPETGSNRTVELYRAKSFPFDWTLQRVLIDNVSLYDVTLIQHRNKWWMFAAIASDSGSAQDELAIFYSDFLEGPWHPHALNPVKSDCRSARPAGRIVMHDGRLLRPAQDCEEHYGAGIVWLEIKDLTPDHYFEQEVTRWSGRTILQTDGIHTYNQEGGMAAIDYRRVKWKSLLAKWY